MVSVGFLDVGFGGFGKGRGGFGSLGFFGEGFRHWGLLGGEGGEIWVFGFVRNGSGFGRG